MEKELVGFCPRCNEKLIATHLVCKNCDLELKADFDLSKFDYLKSDEIDFINSFLKCQGSFKALQEVLGVSYPAAKKKLSEIIIKLSCSDNGVKEKEVSYVAKLTSVPILNTDSFIVKRIKQKLNQSNGSAIIELLLGDSCEIWYSQNNKGLESSKIPIANQLTWEVFDAAVELVIEKGGRVEKGNARAGKLGSTSLPFDSLEGYIAHKVHGIQAGGSAFGPGFVVCAVLEWAVICKNERGYISMYPEFLSEYKRYISANKG